MRLIDTTSHELKEFVGDPINPRFPRYAILSHTWGEEEVTFQDIQNLDAAKKKAGFRKIARCCKTALDEGLGWTWVDTCCIDKSSSAELNEAINSMFKWYECATTCYAYLSDVLGAKPVTEPGSETYIERCDWTKSRWFTRGWTLQELVAPFDVIIYDRDWRQLGTKRRLAKELGQRTGIPEEVLVDSVLRRKHSVAARMSWAGGRRTTRIEDRAYSLLGLFDITNMPLVYGEGKKSMSRLQQMIMDIQQDDTIFLGGLGSPDHELGELSAESLEPTLHGHGFLITPDNVPARLLTAVSPLPNTSDTSYLTDQLATQLYTSGSTNNTWEQRDVRLRGNVLSMPMRIIQVTFSKYGVARLPITMKQQYHVGLDPASAKALEDFDLYGLRAEGAALCLGMLRCGAEDNQPLARYFLCFQANGELWAYPTGVYRYTRPEETNRWPHMKCHILLSEDSWKPYPLLEPLRDAAGWGMETQLNGAFTNGWTWDAVTTNNTEIITNDPEIGLAKTNTHCYRLTFGPGGQNWDLALSLRANRNFSRDKSKNDVDIEIQLQCATSAEPCAQIVKLKHGDHEGPVTELCYRMPVLGGSAELVTSLYYGVVGKTRYYSPMIRFRAFEPDDNE